MNDVKRSGNLPCKLFPDEGIKGYKRGRFCDELAGGGEESSVAYTDSKFGWKSFGYTPWVEEGSHVLVDLNVKGKGIKKRSFTRARKEIIKPTR